MRSGHRRFGPIWTWSNCRRESKTSSRNSRDCPEKWRHCRWPWPWRRKWGSSRTPSRSLPTWKTRPWENGQLFLTTWVRNQSESTCGHRWSTGVPPVDHWGGIRRSPKVPSVVTGGTWWTHNWLPMAPPVINQSISSWYPSSVIFGLSTSKYSGFRSFSIKIQRYSIRNKIFAPITVKYSDFRSYSIRKQLGALFHQSSCLKIPIKNKRFVQSCMRNCIRCLSKSISEPRKKSVFL